MISMKMFQKIQLLSSFIPNLSVIFVFFTTFIYCCKAKKNYKKFSILSMLCLLIIGSIWNWIGSFNKFWLTYVIIVPLVFVFNIFMIKIQNNCIETAEKEKTEDKETGDKETETAETGEETGDGRDRGRWSV